MQGMDFAKYEDFLNKLKVGISIFDDNGTFLYVSNEILRTSGRSRADYIGKHIHEFIEKGIYEKSIVDIVYQTKMPEARLQTTVSANGDKRTYYVKVSPIFDGQGNIVYALSERYDLEELNQEYQLAEQIEGAYIVATPSEHSEIIAESEEMKNLLYAAELVAKTDATVLISGESGTGKEVFAHYIHENSVRGNHDLVIVNCASLPETLLEAELFGYEKGAFTGALRGGKPGLIEVANGGTLFLDEINSIPLSVQAKLLRTLETKTFISVGSVKVKQTDFRLIAATNADLEDEVKKGAFRADLYYRLNVIPLELPPLREHKADIIPLIDNYLSFFCKKYSVQKELSREVYNSFLQYDWPGNIRELRNMVERMVVMSTSTTIKIEQIPKAVFPCQPEAEKNCGGDTELAMIKKAWKVNHGIREKMANYLGISRRTLQYKLKKYNLI